MKKFTVLLFLLLSTRAFSIGEWFVSGDNVKTFKNGSLYSSGLYYNTSLVDPKSVATNGSKGSVISNANGIYYKNDSGTTTNWLKLLTDTSLPTIGTSGQLLAVNSAGAANEYRSLLGTANQITVVSATGSITLSAPQNIHTAASPTFTGMTMSGLTASNFIKTDGAKTFVSASGVNLASEVSGILPVANGGSQNKLLNPSFEEAVAGESWTSTSGTLTNVTADTVDGLKYAQVALTAQVLNFSQTTATSASLVGLQAEASVYVMAPSTVNNLQLCARVNSADTLTCSDTFSGTDSWQLKAIPFVLGSTNNGLVLKTTGVATGNIAIDNARLIIGDVKNTASVVTAWQSYTPVFTGFGTVTTSNLKWRQNATNVEIAGTFVLGTTTNTEQRMTLPNGYTGSTIITVLERAGDVAANISLGTSQLLVLREPSVSYVTFGTQVSGTAGLLKTAATGPWPSAGQILSLQATIPVNELAGNVTTISQPAPPSAQIKWANVANCSFTTSSGSFVDAVDTDCTYASATTLGSTVTPSAAGGLALKIPTLAAGRYKVTVNSEMASVASASCGFQLVDSANSKTIGPQHAYSVPGNEGMTGSFSGIVEYSATVANVEFKLQVNSSGGGTCRIGINNDISSTSISIEPIAANIVGNFVNTMNTSSGSAHDFFTFSFGTTNLATNCTSSPCFLDQGTQTNMLSVSREGTGLYTLNFSKTYAKIWCLGKGYDTTNGDTQIRGYVGGTPTVNMCSNCNSLRIQSYYQTVASSDVYATISCHGY